ncbi:universal stress protein [Deinococcus maricopensis]|uniref:UspA domain-containing protein n=1 Tax=Deinococcus maricopensis (strain DSM 21211 / LMG 22137 / NRRL B-23946 / LB-34) TaxID=709986 RepID=E8U4S8_DEIML|nr:universal stress protein [Deinococcus maricopensis]ADV66067.1 UspA domain-containing protein [Deinococcus maricopensis DSM 21211]
MFRHILVPVDDALTSAQAAQYAFTLTRALGGQATLLRLLENPSPAAHERASAQLSALAREARRPPRQVILPLHDHDAVQAITAYAQGQQVDLIVLGVTGEGGLTDEAVGRLATTLARTSGVPVHLAAVTRAGRPAGSNAWRRAVTRNPPPPDR